METPFNSISYLNFYQNFCVVHAVKGWSSGALGSPVHICYQNLDYNCLVNFPSYHLHAMMHHSSKLKRFANIHNLEQMICIPTRVTETSRSTIDLLLLNNHSRIIEHCVITASISDHDIIFCIVKAGVSKRPPRIIRKGPKRSWLKLNSSAE